MTESGSTRRKITLDPLTRIEGHLGITVEVADGLVVDAWSAGTMARGIEKLLIGRDPLDAPYVTSRFCGVCFSVHQYASIAAIEAASGAQPPWAGRLLRNLVMAAEYLYDHVLHFYQLSAPDFLDLGVVASYAGADPALQGLRDRVVGLLQAQDLAPFSPTYAPDAFCVRDPEVVTTLLAHYVQALSIHSKARRMGALLGGRAPHYQALVPGGFTRAPDKATLDAFKLALDEVIAFVREVYVPDVIALAAGPLAPLGQSGLGGGQGNYLACGSFEMDPDGERLLFPAGVIRGFTLPWYQVEPFEPKRVTESVTHAWYRQTEAQHPTHGEQEFDLDKKGAYSFVKAPRYAGLPMEVGPLARMLVARDKRLLDLMQGGMKPGLLARHAARAIETLSIADAALAWLETLRQELARPGVRIHDTAHWVPPKKGDGAGFYEAPRGALGHWIQIREHKIAGYQAVVPTTWNASPRDEAGLRGPYEESLLGAPVPDPENPIMPGRVVRSFDPCLGCAIHVIDARDRRKA